MSVSKIPEQDLNSYIEMHQDVCTIRFNFGETTVDDYLPESFYAERENIRDVALNLMKDKLQESFAEGLKRLIEEKNMTPPEFQRKACITPATYSNIVRNGVIPKKDTALACAVGLELSIDEADKLIGKAGYVLTPSDLRDVIVMSYLDRKDYDVIEINEVLLARNLPLIGQRV